MARSSKHLKARGWRLHANIGEDQVKALIGQSLPSFRSRSGRGYFVAGRFQHEAKSGTNRGFIVNDENPWHGLGSFKTGLSDKLPRSKGPSLMRERPKSHLRLATQGVSNRGSS